MPVDLTTTNILLGVLSVAAVIEVVAIAVLCVGVFTASRRFAAILEDVHQVTGTVKAQVETVDRTIRWILRRFGAGAA